MALIKSSLLAALLCITMTPASVSFAEGGAGLSSSKVDPSQTVPVPSFDEKEPVEWSGIYPHLACFNQENECGTGAVVPWANRLWVITYAPHKPKGSTDKLYEIDAQLRKRIRPESVGGTPAGRMIHRESQQLFIGPYAIDADRNVRVMPPEKLFGRLTGIARHLTEPDEKIYYATMEEGFYEIDVSKLNVTELYPDTNRAKDFGGKLLPGYHGKGLYSGQGVLVYANNGDASQLAKSRPDIPSGCLAEWDGKNWIVVRRNQFTEVTGPGGLHGNENPETDPIWSIGWDHRSLILMVRERGAWHSYRLPKASHCYDGAHGWNTEWPRIRDIGEDDWLMTMHGMFWRFPPTFSRHASGGIAPRSTYLKVIGDFCRWQDRLVFGCDDTAKAEFLNKRKAKGALAGPGQSHSNLWFLPPEKLDSLGPIMGRGAVWLNDVVSPDTPSEPFLFSGFERKGLHLACQNGCPQTFRLEIDAEGTDDWAVLRDIIVPDTGYSWIQFQSDEKGAWIRLRLLGAEQAIGVSAVFQYSEHDPRGNEASSLFEGLASRDSGASYSGGLLWAKGETLQYLAQWTTPNGQSKQALYELDESMGFSLMEDRKATQWMEKDVSIPTEVILADDASAVYIDDQNRRYRLPFAENDWNATHPLGAARVDREVCTERDLFNCAGIFYELPAQNAGGFSKVRPITTHNRAINDYASWRGLLVMTGIDLKQAQENRHILPTPDGNAALWVGALDDLWQLGKPRGVGGPWESTPLSAGAVSDPYLMTGFDQKTLTLSHTSNGSVGFSVDVDISGTGLWQPYKSFSVPSGKGLTHRFPDAFQAYWLRLVSHDATTATAQLQYD
jgi:hypothetical protein